MKYVVLDEKNMVKDILHIPPYMLYLDARYVEAADDVKLGVGMMYDEKTDTFGEYIEPVSEPTQLDKIEANIDYLVLLNS